MLFPYYLSIGFITFKMRKSFVVFGNNNDSVDDQYLLPRVMKGNIKGVKVKGMSFHIWKDQRK